MSKPLELTVYPPNGFGYQVPLRVWSPPSCDPDDDFRVVVSEDDIQKRIESKRLTDAELAAEVFSAVFHESECEVRARQVGEGHPSFNHWLKANHEYARQAEIVERFATLPHYDEVAA